ncbi:MAG: DUF1553 domain-containing protein [Synoicihabitans sp.]
MLLFWGGGFVGLQGADAEVSAVDFSRQILPILSDNCFQCHGPDANHREADLRLDVEENAKAPREGYSIIEPGDSTASELIYHITTRDEYDRMPPLDSNKSLSEPEIDLLTRWIDSGAEWGRHWAFDPIERPQLSNSSAHPIDVLVGEVLAEEGLTFSPEADRRSLIRRLTLDLTGLPPTPDETEAFVADKSNRALESVVKRLLASPAFGERMAWDWMEVARYADTNGYQADNERTMWPWRDWVVKAFNENLPFDEFTIWQLAGDLIPEASEEQIMATAFLRNHPINGEGGRIPEENRVDYVLDMTDTVGTAWLGLTLSCARCHDHKFDPISQREYYSLSAYFNQTAVTGSGGNPKTPPVLDFSTPDEHERLAAEAAKIPALAAIVDELELTVFPRPEGEPSSKSERVLKFDATILNPLDGSASRRGSKSLRKILEVAVENEPAYETAVENLIAVVAAREAIAAEMIKVMVMEDMPEPRETYLLNRGLYSDRGDVVTAGVPASLPALGDDAPANRLGLARWIVSDENPLTARVVVNRYWQMLFGIGLANTPEDFGVQGEIPRQAKLLDWLADEFISSGWDVKGLLYKMVTSGTYRQRTHVTADLLERDPENRLLARGPRYRMPAWMLRDQALAVSGLLVDQPGGPGVFPYQPSGVWAEASFDQRHYKPDTGKSLYRRSLYTFWRRTSGPTVFFDAQARFVCTVNTPRTNTPMHALALLNDTTYVEASRVMAEATLLRHESNADRLTSLFIRTLARPPDEEETQILLDGLARHLSEFEAFPRHALELVATGDWRVSTELDAVEHAAWTLLCLSVLNLDETLNKG